MPKALARKVRASAKEMAERIGSPNAAAATQAKALDYYRSVIVGDGPETVDGLRQRIGESQYADVLKALNVDAKHRVMER